MKKKYILLAINFFLILSNKPISAQELIDWATCVSESKRNNPELISAKEKLNQAIADRKINQSVILPEVIGNISVERDKNANDLRSDKYSYGLTGKQLLFDGLKSHYKIISTVEDIKSAKYEYDVTSSNIRYRLKTAFVELLKVVELLNLTKEIAERREQNLTLIKLSYEAGREHRGALLTAEANFEQAKYDIANAQRSISLAQRKLIKELGIRSFKNIYAKGELKTTNFNTVKPDFDSIANSNPIIKSLIAKKESSKYKLKSAKGDFMPEIFANGSINAASSRKAGRWPQPDDEWAIGIGVNIPLYTGGSKFAQLSKNKALLNQTSADELSGRDSVIYTMEQSWVNYQNAFDKLKVIEKFLNAYTERAKIAQAQYATGLIGFDNWTIIEDDLVTAKKNYLNANTDLMIAQATWEQAQGKTLDDN